MSRGYRLQELADHVEGKVEGDGDRIIRGIAVLDRAGDDELSFFTNPKYRKAARATRAAALLVGPRSRVEGAALLVCTEPYLALARLLALFHPLPEREATVSAQASIDPLAVLGRDPQIGPFAVIEPEATLGDRVNIGAGAVIGAGCKIGDETEIRPGVVLYPGTIVGARCLIHSGVVLGADGFGFATAKGQHHKVPQLGRVVVEDEVELGANTTVDRGTLDETVVGRGSKIDDQVMIAHGVRLGDGCLLAAQSGVAGSSRLGERVTLAGQTGVAGHLEIADGTVVGAKSAVFGDIEQPGFIAGIPAVDHRVWKRSQALIRRLPELRQEMRSLEERLARLEARLAGDEEN